MFFLSSPAPDPSKPPISIWEVEQITGCSAALDKSIQKVGELPEPRSHKLPAWSAFHRAALLSKLFGGQTVTCCYSFTASYLDAFWTRQILIHFPKDIVAKKQLAPIWEPYLIAKRPFGLLCALSQTCEWRREGRRERHVTLAPATEANALFTLPCQSVALDNFTIHYPIFNHQRRAKSKCGE